MVIICRRFWRGSSTSSSSSSICRHFWRGSGGVGFPIQICLPTTERNWMNNNKGGCSIKETNVNLKSFFSLPSWVKEFRTAVATIAHPGKELYKYCKAIYCSAPSIQPFFHSLLCSPLKPLRFVRPSQSLSQPQTPTVSSFNAPNLFKHFDHVQLFTKIYLCLSAPL